ncbi:MAG: hypothetical protein JWN61_2701, partial [Pseudonocardiales bacterium]|nr:hypothetical protein [Pseudonocardiales bacterium]
DKACTGASAAIAAGLPVPTGPGWTIGGPTPAPGPVAELSPPTAARPPAYVQDTLGF